MFNFGPKVPQVDVDDLRAVSVGEQIGVILDVRTPEEYARGHVKGSINIPLDSLSKNVEQQLEDKEQKIYVYCLSGSRSAVAVNQMLQMGYKQVLDTKSGLLAWRAKQYPLV